MTTEQKAKAYDEILVKAMELKEANPSDKGIQRWLDDTFPNLAESEDERIRKIITLCLEECVHSDIIRDYEKDNAIAWLEKTGKPVEINPTEHNPTWSEEDEAHFDSILKRLEGMCKPGAKFTTTRCSVGKDKDWLKSLKGRYTWKPSDVQMKLLKEACDQHWEPDGLDPLYTLYQDLKKLKEE